MQLKEGEEVMGTCRGVTPKWEEWPQQEHYLTTLSTRHELSSQDTAQTTLAGLVLSSGTFPTRTILQFGHFGVLPVVQEGHNKV